MDAYHCQLLVKGQKIPTIKERETDGAASWCCVATPASSTVGGHYQKL